MSTVRHNREESPVSKPARKSPPADREDRVQLATDAAFQAANCCIALLKHAGDIDSQGGNPNTIAVVRALAGRCFALNEAIYDLLTNDEEFPTSDLEKVVSP